jgi:hypothetical protein
MRKMQQTALPLLDQKFMAFEGLLAWAKAIVRQAGRVSEAQDRLKNIFREIPYEPRVAFNAEPIREVGHVFKVERHLFCNASDQFFEHRRWLGRLGDFDEGIFAEIDIFEPNVNAMRDLNEHAIEYFEGRGRRPKDWMFSGDDFNSDPTGTINTLIGGRLDWVKLSQAADRLLKSLPSMLPIPSR